MHKLISQSCDDSQSVVSLPREDGAIWRLPKHSWMSDRLEKKAWVKADSSSFSSIKHICCWSIYVATYLTNGDKKCFLKPCKYKTPFWQIWLYSKVCFEVKIKSVTIFGHVYPYCHIHCTFDSDFICQFWLWSPNLVYANTPYNHMYYKTMYTEYCPVCQTKIFTNVYYVPICQTYCSSNLQRIRY